MLEALRYTQAFLSQRIAQRLNLDDRGVTAVEYALLVVLVALVMGVGAVVLGGGLSGLFSKVGSTVSKQTVPNP